MPYFDDDFYVPVHSGQGSTLNPLDMTEIEKTKPIGFVLPEERKKPRKRKPGRMKRNFKI